MGCQVSRISKTYVEDTSLMTLLHKLSLDNIESGDTRHAITLLVGKNQNQNQFTEEELFENARYISSTITFEEIILRNISISDELTERLNLFKTKNLVFQNISASKVEEMYCLILSAATSTEATNINIGRISCPHATYGLRRIFSQLKKNLRITSLDFGLRALSPELRLTKINFYEETEFNGKSIDAIVKALSYSKVLEEIHFHLLFGNNFALGKLFDQEVREQETFVRKLKYEVQMSLFETNRFVPIPHRAIGKKLSFFFLCDVHHHLFFSSLGLHKGINILPNDILGDFYGNPERREQLVFLADHQIINLGFEYKNYGTS